MSDFPFNIKDIFNLSAQDDAGFEKLALEIFRFQCQENQVYKAYCNYLKIEPYKVETLAEIPFLPISFFKTHKVATSRKEEIVFTSSGTENYKQSRHYVHLLSLYEESYNKGFEMFYGSPSDYCILALLPGYLERKGSSLIYMFNDLIKKSGNKNSGFYLDDLDTLCNQLRENEAKEVKTILIGVSFALMDFAEKYEMDLKNTIVMETGGMKGKRKEITREELHGFLKKRLKVAAIHSEYGMTELLSQAYCKGGTIFTPPPWMKVLIRQINDPFSYENIGKTGGVNVIDLANIYSCSFIETQDLGKKFAGGTFEILGRFDNSDIRGCNLMVD